METALERASQLSSPSEILLLQKQFERIQQMLGANGLFRRVASATDREQLGDYLADPTLGSRPQTFNYHLSQGFLVAKLLDYIEDFYAGQLAVGIVVSGDPFS